MGDLLYHYCSSSAGLNMLRSRTIRLSPLSVANDSLEGLMVGRLFARALAKTGLSAEVARVASIAAQGYGPALEGFAFCMSEADDLLSQWRAYADDGHGLSVGFDPVVLTRDFGAVNFGSQYYEMLKVTYGEESVRTEIESVAQNTFDTLSPLGPFVRVQPGMSDEQALTLLADRAADAKGIFEGQPEPFEKLLEALRPLQFRLHGLKPASFHEEREWRLIRYQHRAASPNLEFVADRQTIRPYVSCLIADQARLAIRRVVLGPKHRSDPNWVRAFLRSVGLADVAVARSAIDSYR